MKLNEKAANRRMLGYTAAIWLAGGLLVSSAHAGDERTETVKFADLDLSSSAGVEVLYTRIHAAARRVCDQPAGEQAAVGRCMKKAEKDTIGKVDAPLLTAFYQRKAGIQPPTIAANR
jgi:UrcA family protein